MSQARLREQRLRKSKILPDGRRAYRRYHHADSEWFIIDEEGNVVVDEFGSPTIYNPPTEAETQQQEMMDQLGSYFGASEGFFDRAGDIFDRAFGAISDFRGRHRDRTRDYMSGLREYQNYVRNRSRSDANYWNLMRDRALGAQEAGLQSWDDVVQAQGGFLTDLRDSQVGLARQLADSPSAVAEQARLNADRALNQSVAMAGVLGGGISSNLGALGAQSDNILGNVLADTSALRAQEHAGRIGQQAGILGQAGATSGALAGLGLQNLSAQSNFGNFLANLGTRNMDIGSNLINRETNLFSGLGQVLNFGSAGDLAEIGAYGGLGSGMAGLGRGLAGLGSSTYGIMHGERAWAKGLQDEADRRMSEGWGALAKFGLPLLGTIGGGLIGGVPGALFAGALGGVSAGGRGGSSDAFYPKLPFEQGQYSA